MRHPLHLIVGLGKTGRSIANYLNRRNQPFIAFDTRSTPEGLNDFQRDFPEVEIFLETFPESLYAQLTQIITSPGVSLEHPVLERARNLQIPIIGDIECLAREIKAPVIAITGTNGKSTVTS